MQNFIAKTVQSIRKPRNRIQLVIEKFIHQQNGAIGDFCRPLIDVCDECFYYILCADDPFEIVVRFTKKTA
jgi:hypothetical protein